MSDSNKTHKNKLLFIDALRRALGRVTDAAKETKLSRENHYTWLKEDEEYSKAVDDVKEQAIDYVESMLFKRINGYRYLETTREKKEFGEGLEVTKEVMKEVLPSVQAITFYLETQAKSRGYQRKIDVDITDKTVSERTAFSLKCVHSPGDKKAS